MPSSPRLAVIGIDGADPETLTRYIAAGRLPAIAEAIGRSQEVTVKTAGDLFLTSVWPCAVSGVSVENHGLHAFAPLRSGTLDIVEATDFRMPAPFWETAVRAGLRACVVDVPLYGPPAADSALDGLRYLEWGSHPPVREPGSFPPALAPAIVARHGLHPCRADDPWRSTMADVVAIRDRLCEGARLHGQVLADLLDDDPPDLFVAVLSEAHSAGHQLLHLNEPGHPCYDAEIAAALGESPLQDVYAAVDAEVGALLRRFGPETTVLMTGVLGVRVTYGGSQLLGDLLIRMGLSVPARSLRTRAVSLYRSVVPEPVRDAIRRRLPEPVITREARVRFTSAFDWTATQAVALPWTYEGYLRLNLRGREPHGIVNPGADRDALLSRLEETLRDLRIAGTGEPAVVELVRAQEAFPGRAAAELPDLLVLWRNDRRIEAVDSPVYGRIDNRDPAIRSEHSAPGVLFALGPSFVPGGPIASARDVDIAPTVLALLGVTPPSGLDGRPIPELLRRRPAAAIA